MSHSISYIFYTVSCLETYSNEMTLCWIYVLHSQEMEIKEIQLVHRRLVGKIVGAAFQPRLSRLESPLSFPGFLLTSYPNAISSSLDTGGLMKPVDTQ